jgi:N-acetyl-gamma-glutamyl-phosphate reductase
MVECAAMSRPRVLIDGHAGTTGLRIRSWLTERDDLDLFTLDEVSRKSTVARRQAIAESDIALLCLPDDAAAEAAGWAKESGSRVIDASSNHRVADGWVYGLPELESEQRAAIRGAQYVTNPGCYPSAFILLMRPLLDAGLLAPDAPISCHALSGYSGGGRALIERWESNNGLKQHLYEAPYAAERVHKHVPEMQRYAGLLQAPQFLPAVGPFSNGMRVQIPIHAALMAPGVTGKTIWETLSDRYRSEVFVKVEPFTAFAPLDEWALDPTVLNGTNNMSLHVVANPAGHALLVGLLDNLGKGASGVAIQSLNLMLGLGEGTGLPHEKQA